MRSLTVMLVLLACLQAALGQKESTQAPAAAPAPPASQAVPTTAAPASPPAQTPPRRKTMPGSKAAKATPPADTSNISPTTPVITIVGLCSTAAPKPKTATTAAAAKKTECPPTVVTKAQLERLIESVRPNLPANQRLSLAQQYVQLLTVANAASKAGMETDPKVKEELQLQKLQILASAYSKQIAQKTSEISDADLEKYYNDHRSQYEAMNLQRIYVPLVMTADGKPTDEATTKTLAEKIQKRAAAGEDFEKLEKEAFEQANNKNAPPAIDLGERRRGSLPPKQEAAVFELKPGDVSAVYEETSGAFIYKVVSKQVTPLDKVKDEIKSTMARERFRDKMDELKAGVQPDFNQAYFAAAGPPSPAAGGAPHPAAPPAGAATPNGTAPPASPAPQATTAAPAASAQPAAAAQPAPPASTEAPKTPDPSTSK